MDEIINKRKEKTIIIVSVIAIVLSVIGISYAYFSAISRSEVKTVKTGILSLKFDDSTSIINSNNIIPISEDQILTKSTKKTFTIKNTGTSTQYVDINLTNIVATGLKVYDLKWALYEGNNKITTGNFASISDETKINLTNNVKLEKDETKVYNLYIWIQETNKPQDSLQNKTLTAIIQAKGNQNKSNTLVSVILGENNANVNTSDPSFTSTSTDNGLFVQKNDSTKSNYGFSTYYYRGSVTNNYVKLGTYKADVINKISDGNSETEKLVAKSGDDILWRIVRINEDGSIKLISEYNITNGYHIWNSNNLSKYVNDDSTKSDIKATLDNWYNENIYVDNNIDSKIQKGDFCNDISDNYSTLYNRIITSQSPIFTCPNDAIMVNEKVGLISMDEMIYAGALKSPVENNTTYLNNNSYFWTISPRSSSYIFAWSPDYLTFGATDANDSTAASARPVITLKSDVIVIDGDGSKDNPYVIN